MLLDCVDEFKQVHLPTKQRFPGSQPCTLSPGASSPSKPSSSLESDLLRWKHVLWTGAPYSRCCAFSPPAGLLFIFGSSALRLADPVAVARLLVVSQDHKTLVYYVVTAIKHRTYRKKKHLTFNLYVGFEKYLGKTSSALDLLYFNK